MGPKDVLTALFVVVVLGVNFVAIKVGLSELPPLLLTALRFLFAAIPAAFLVKTPRAPARIVVGFGLMLGVVQFGLLFVAIAMGASAGLSSLIIQLQVFFTIGLAWLLLGEAPSGYQLAGGLVAATGIVIIGVLRSQAAPFLPLLLVVGAAMAWAVANTLSKRAGRIDMLGLMVWGSMAAWPPLLALSLVFEGSRAVVGALAGASLRSAAAVAFLAYPTTLLAFGLWNRLLGRHPAASVAPFGLLVPVVGITSTRVFVGEPLDFGEAIGAGIVMAGLALNVRGASRRASANACPASKAAAGATSQPLSHAPEARSR